LLAILFLFLFCPSNLFNIFRDFYLFSCQPGEIKIQFYQPDDVIKAIKWLGTQPRDQIILADILVARLFPGIAGQSVYLSHWHETLFPDSKVAYLGWFYRSNESDSAKLKFLDEQGIDYIFYSDYEKRLGDFNPAKKDYLKLVFDRPKAQVYQVIFE